MEAHRKVVKVWELPTAWLPLNSSSLLGDGLDRNVAAILLVADESGGRVGADTEEADADGIVNVMHYL